MEVIENVGFGIMNLIAIISLILVIISLKNKEFYKNLKFFLFFSPISLVFYGMAWIQIASIMMSTIVNGKTMPYYEARLQGTLEKYSPIIFIACWIILFLAYKKGNKINEEK